MKAVKARRPPADWKTHGLTFGVSLMLAMPFVETSNKRPHKGLDAQQVEKVLYHLHSAGIVFGDLRYPRIFFDGFDFD